VGSGLVGGVPSGFELEGGVLDVEVPGQADPQGVQDLRAVLVRACP
jgi:hypothetical protein